MAFEQLRIGRKLDFRDSAATNRNVAGNMNPEKIMREYNFKELALDETNLYTKYIDSTGSVALAAGGVTLTTAATDTKVSSYGFGGISVKCAKNPVMEAMIQIDAITNVGIYVGFAQAASYASSLLPIGIVTATGTYTATEAAGFVFDTRQTLAYFNCAWVKASAGSFTQLGSTYVPVAATNLTLRVALDTLGNSYFYFNGVQVGYKATSNTVATALVPIIAERNNTASAHNLTIRYVRLWEDA